MFYGHCGLLKYFVPWSLIVPVDTLQATNPQLVERITALGNGLVRFAGLVPNESNVLLLLNDSIGMWNSWFTSGSPDMPIPSQSSS
jgi:hypothetical protein